MRPNLVSLGLQVFNVALSRLLGFKRRPAINPAKWVRWFRPRLEPLEARVMPACTNGVTLLAVSTHLLGDYQQGPQQSSVKPVVLMRDGEGTVFTDLLSNVLATPGMISDQDADPLAGVPQGPASYDAVAKSLGLSAPYTSTGVVPMAGGS
jgi:hypothetical protein